MVIAPEPGGRPVISFQQVWKTYPNGNDALRDICLTVAEGDFLFLVGASGAGKSSLVRLLIREEKPTRGRLIVHGQDLGGLRRRHLPHFRRKVGLVFQDFKLLPRMTVHENVAFALQAVGVSRRVIAHEVGAALETVGLAGMERRYPGELSGGEQQRVAIARALVHRPRLFIADEPTGNLDPGTAWEIMQILSRINGDGVTVLMATHNREIVDLMHRRVVALERGQIVRDDRYGRYNEALPAAAVCAH
jgi:cell division transport system ATP-binding protein